MMLEYFTLLKNGSIIMKWTITCHVIFKKRFLFKLLGIKCGIMREHYFQINIIIALEALVC